MSLAHSVQLVRLHVPPLEVARQLLEEPQTDSDVVRQARFHKSLLTLSHLAPIATGSAAFLMTGGLAPLAVAGVGSALRLPMTMHSVKALNARIKAHREVEDMLKDVPPEHRDALLQAATQTAMVRAAYGKPSS